MGKIFFKSGKDKFGEVPKTFFELTANDIDGNLFNFSTLQ